MGCIAIWCSSDNGQASSHQLEVHFNLWRARKKPLGTTDFLDVGLMLPTGNSADCIKPTTVIMFRSHFHFSHRIAYDGLKSDKILNGPPQSIIQITDAGYKRL